MVLEGGWGPIVVVVSPQNGEAIKEVSPILAPTQYLLFMENEIMAVVYPHLQGYEESIT
jgi:hypothetical protein